jgi:hypothetical protein
MLCVITGIVCLLVGGAGGFLWGGKVQRKAQQVGQAARDGVQAVKKAL